MQPMTTFDPHRPCRVHDRFNDKTFQWRTAWAHEYRQYACPCSDDGHGIVYFDDLVLDGWES